jgi:hypothetical protein
MAKDLCSRQSGDITGAGMVYSGHDFRAATASPSRRISATCAAMPLRLHVQM